MAKKKPSGIFLARGAQKCLDMTMLLTTTGTIDGKSVAQYLGIVSAEAVAGINVFRDLFAGIRDIIGGRAGGYEKVLSQAKDQAMADLIATATELGANAVIGIDIDYQAVGDRQSMLMVVVSGTAVRVV
jgi:uncharacterized protein YbjQ (UPF0145 family)